MLRIQGETLNLRGLAKGDIWMCVFVSFLLLIMTTFLDFYSTTAIHLIVVVNVKKEIVRGLFKKC